MSYHRQPYEQWLYLDTRFRLDRFIYRMEGKPQEQWGGKNRKLFRKLTRRAERAEALYNSTTRPTSSTG